MYHKYHSPCINITQKTHLEMKPVSFKTFYRFLDSHDELLVDQQMYLTLDNQCRNVIHVQQMNKSLKSSLKSYDKEVDTRSLYHTTIGIFMTRDRGDVSVNVWMDTVTSNNTRQLSIISAWVTSVG